MSNTAHDSTTAPRNPSTPVVPAELTGAPAAIHTALMRLTEEATATELALAAGVGRSTAGKALTKLEQRGLAVRIAGGFDGPHRTPDLWRATPTPDASGNAFVDHEFIDALLDVTTSDTPEPVGRDASPGDADAAGPVPDTTAAPDDGAMHTADAPPVLSPLNVPARDTTPDGSADGGDKRPRAERGTYNRGNENIPATQAGTGRQSSPPEAIILSDTKKRLGPGALRQMVTEYLQAHPGQAFTATKISRMIEKSSGAIANALVTLTRQGVAEQVDDQPRTYRLAPPENN